MPNYKLKRSNATSFKKKGSYGKKSFIKKYNGWTRVASKTQIMSNPVPRHIHNIVAPRFFTDVEYGYTGQLSTGLGYNFDIYANGLQFPGNTSNPFTSAGGTLFPATHSLAALQPTGLSALSVLYKSYRVWRSSITVSVTPSAAGAIGFLVVLPTQSEGALADAQLAQSLPYSKVIQVSNGGATKDNTVIMNMDTKTIYGISEAQMMADPDFYSAIGSNPTSPWFWNILASSFSGAATSFSVLIRCNYRVEFFNPANSEIDT